MPTTKIAHPTDPSRTATQQETLMFVANGIVEQDANQIYLDGTWQANVIVRLDSTGKLFAIPLDYVGADKSKPDAGRARLLASCLKGDKVTLQFEDSPDAAQEPRLLQFYNSRLSSWATTSDLRPHRRRPRR